MYNKSLKNFFTELSSSSRLYPYKHVMRVSSFPFCPREYVLAQYWKEPLYSNETYALAHYADIGTLQHTALQMWLGRGGILFGNWECERCSHTVSNQLGPQNCLKHGEMTFVEYSYYDAKTGMTGHSDGVLQACGDPSLPLVAKLRDVYDNLHLAYDIPMILEVKTRSSAAIQSYTEPEWYTYLQGNTYACLLREHVKELPIVSHVLIYYISRQNHRVYTWFLRKVNFAAFESLQQEILGAKEMSKQKRLPLGICLGPSDKNAEGCVFQKVCFSPTIAASLKLEEI